ncbi:hypothetical protein HPB48_000835 [Haemaphysalis longicornis]|uniref:Uncharacterized protein n=1 Tax=Haemaphysalis longicornis TaxID=44386 RepID=A0A9J6GYR2_HAELO|nr:hypothetical protein HPB48_000835 [Haemaphysalis longicornis]
MYKEDSQSRLTPSCPPTDPAARSAVVEEIYILLADEIPTKTNGNEWSEGETLLLLDKYATYLDMVGPMKRFRHKKAMWQHIADEIFQQLGVQKTPIAVYEPAEDCKEWRRPRQPQPQQAVLACSLSLSSTTRSSKKLPLSMVAWSRS